MRKNTGSLRPEEHRLLAEFLWWGPMTRDALMQRMGISKSRLRELIVSLTDQGWITRGTPSKSTGGRRPLVHALEAARGCVLSLAISPNAVRVLLADAALVSIDRAEHGFSTTPPPAPTMVKATELADALLQKNGFSRADVIATGVSVASPVNHRTGIVAARSPVLEGWEGFGFKEFLQDGFGRVHVENNATAMAAAELWAARRIGHAQGGENIVVINVGRGIGAGIISNGRIHRGEDTGAGEIGHIIVAPGGMECHCGQAGCLETVAASAAIVERARKLAEHGKFQSGANQPVSPCDITLEHVLSLAAEGQIAAMDLLDDAGAQIGQVAASVANILGPSHILIGGRLVDDNALLLAGFRRAFFATAMPALSRNVSIGRLRFGDQSSLKGAGILALNALMAT